MSDVTMHSSQQQAAEQISHVARFNATLKQAKKSMTEPRRLIFTHLLQGPASIAEMAESLAESVDRTSVYRTIELFDRLGIVNRVWHGFKDQVELSEVFIPHHHHAVCERCGTAIDIISNDLEALLSKVAKSQGFLMVEHSVEITGYCARCQMR
jgi:Fur family transcriptional regulator, ferric uptake regulator